jgi:hypothetical protein
MKANLSNLSTFGIRIISYLFISERDSNAECHMLGHLI